MAMVHGQKINHTFPNVDEAQAEVEKGLVDPNSPGGRHRAQRILPIVPRIAKK